MNRSSTLYSVKHDLESVTNRSSTLCSVKHDMESVTNRSSTGATIVHNLNKKKIQENKKKEVKTKDNISSNSPRSMQRTGFFSSSPPNSL